MRGLFVVVLMVLHLPGAAAADLKQLNVRTDRFTAGAFCAYPSGRTMPAPATRDGTVDYQATPYRMVIEGDEVPAISGLGVGIIVKLHDFSPGETLTLQTDWSERATPDTWQTTLNDDGTFWFGVVPGVGSSLAWGKYRLAAFRGRETLFIYDILVSQPMKPTDYQLCIAVVS